MPRLPAKQREAEKVATKLPNGSYAAAVNDSPARFSWEVRTVRIPLRIVQLFLRVIMISHELVLVDLG